jgi:hypothetical protein
MMGENKGLVAFGVVLALGMIITGSVVSKTYFKVKSSDNTINVTGSAQKIIESDTARWNANFNRTVGADQLKDGSVQIKKDLDAVTDYLTKNGVKKEQITINPVTVYPNYEPLSNGYGSSGRVSGYNVSQQITVESNDVNNLTSIAQGSTSLLSQGIVFSSQPVEYYYSKLDDLKIEMLGAATDNAKQRAQTIAGKSGADLGGLKAASMGVFQIVGQNAGEDYSWGGTFNTSSKRKTASITLNCDFEIN